MVRRGRRELRNSSKAQQKHAADSRASEATHGIGALLDPSVILLQTMIEVLVRPMLYMVAQDLASGPWIGTMPICRDRRWRLANHSNRLLEKSLSRLYISFLAQHGINQIPIVVDGPIQITPRSMHFDGGFVNIPGRPSLSMSLGS
jgi:hypothetical protein